MPEAFSRAVAECASHEDVKRLFRAAIAAYGLSASACGAFLPGDNGPEPAFFFTDWPDDWLELYIENNFARDDYLVAEARRRMTSFSWLEAAASREFTPAEQATWRAAQGYGWSDGFATPLHGPGGYFGLVVMARKNGVLGLDFERRLRLATIAALAHERCRQIAGLVLAADDVGLSARELQCMRWVGAGRTDAEIAERMNIAAATVRFHIDGARKKLGARTRAQAVARMVLRSLL